MTILIVGRERERAKALQAPFISVGHNGHGMARIFFGVFSPTEINIFSCSEIMCDLLP